MTSEGPRRRASDRQETGGPGRSGFLLSREQEDRRVLTADDRADASLERRQRDLEWNAPERRTGRS